MSDVEVKSVVDGSLNEDRVPSSTRIYRAEQAKNEQIPLFFLLLLPSGDAAGKRPLLHRIFFSVFSNPQCVNNPPVPSGAAQGAHYPAGTRGDIQAVTDSQ